MNKQMEHENKLASITTYLETLTQEFNADNPLVKADLKRTEIGWDITIHDKKLRLTERLITEYEQKHADESLEDILKILLVEKFNWQEEQ